MNSASGEKKITLAYKQRLEYKRKAKRLGLEYRTQLALVNEEAGEREAATYIRDLNNIELQIVLRDTAHGRIVQYWGYFLNNNYQQRR